LGRLFEGHVNALELVLRYASHEQADLFAEEARAGKMFGVWNTDDSNWSRRSLRQRPSAKVPRRPSSRALRR
jgi:hypothetical protein